MAVDDAILDKLRSRKFWVMVGSVIGMIIGELSGIEIDPAAIAGLGIIVSSYLISQGIVDKSKVAEETKVAGDIAKANAIMYARNLEQQLARITQETEYNGPVAVPDLEA